ncbi:MAG: hypothetical protein WC337_02040 [Candidatus Muiribacteriota bacterium]
MNSLFHHVVELYEKKDYENLKDIYLSIDKNNEKIIYTIIEILLDFKEGNIDRYISNLELLLNYINAENKKEILPFYHLRKHLYYIFVQEYESAMDELGRAVCAVGKYGDINILPKIYIQQIELAAFYMRDFAVAEKLLDKYQSAMSDTILMNTYFNTIKAYIYSYENNNKSLEYVKIIEKNMSSLKKDEYFEEIIIRYAYALINLGLYDKLDNLLEKIDEESPEKYLIKSFYSYGNKNYLKAFNVFSECFEKYYDKKKYDEFWLKIFIIAAESQNHLGNLELAEEFFNKMLDQFDYFYSKIKHENYRKVFVNIYRPYLINTFLFFRNLGKTEVLKNLIEKYEHVFEVIENLEEDSQNLR